MVTNDVAIRATLRRARFAHTERLKRTERIALLIIVSIIATVDLIGFVTSADDTLTRMNHALGIVTTLILALYVWSPWPATLILMAAIAGSLFIPNDAGSLLAGSLAAFLVLRLASTQLILVYVGGLLLFTGVATLGITPRTVAPGDLAGYLFIATVAGTLGFALRMGYERSHLLADRLAEQEAREREALAAERRWIAGELHDSIAHQLTVISLHAQLLDDEQMRETSQEAIRSASRKALSDLRFIIRLAEDTPTGIEAPSGDLGDAIAEACQEFCDAGHPTVVEGDPRDDGISRGAEIILARVVRESATNVIKYAAPGEVRFVVDVQPAAVTMTITSPLAHGSAPRVTSSTGTGLNRMAERVLGVSGEFTAGPVGDKWQVTAHLPLDSPTASGNGVGTTL